MLSVNNFKFFIPIIGSTSLIFLINACSISNGAGSASDSSGSFANSSESLSTSSESSSNNNNKSTKTSQYQSDIMDFTASYVRSTANISDHDNFMKGLSDIATQNGIVDWEASPKTYQAIGLGLKGGQLPKHRFSVFAKQLSQGNHTKLVALQQGYQN